MKQILIRMKINIQNILVCVLVLSLNACARTAQNQTQQSPIEALVAQSVCEIDSMNQLSDTAIDFLQQYDLSQTVLYKNPSYNIHTRYLEATEPLGFRGDNYQRFYIHWDTIYRQTPRIYRIEGRTRCKDEYCDVSGVTVIDSVEFYFPYFFPGIKFHKGAVFGHYTMIATQDDVPVGKLQGQAIYYFWVTNDSIFYSTNGIMDGECGREHRGVFIDMRTNDTLRCNWGDLDIPDSGDLNEGWGCFFVNKKYYDNGWQTMYDSEHLGSCNEPSHAYYVLLNKIDNNWWK